MLAAVGVHGDLVAARKLKMRGGFGGLELRGGHRGVGGADGKDPLDPVRVLRAHRVLHAHGHTVTIARRLTYKT